MTTKRGVRSGERGVALALALALLALAAGLLGARGAQIEWDPVTNVGVSNYSVYIGTASGSYTGKVNVGTALAYPLTTAPGSVTWYRLTATATNGVESDPSGSVSYTNRAFAPNIRINFQGSALLPGTWTNIAQVEMYVERTGEQAFYRAQVEWLP